MNASALDTTARPRRTSAQHRMLAAVTKAKRLDDDRAREERMQQAAQPLAEAFREVVATAHTGRRLSPGWAQARLAQIGEIAIAAGDTDAMRLLTLDLHKLNAELSRPLEDREAETLVAGLVAAGPDLVREAMRRLGIAERA